MEKKKGHMDERLVKGAIVNGYLAFIKEKWGVLGLNSAMKYADIEKQPKDGEWISLSKTYMILEWIEKNHGREHVVEAGKWMIRGMGGDFRFLFASVMGFERMLEKVKNNISSLLFKGNGVEINKEGNEATIRLKGFKIGEMSCLSWKGALMGVMEVTKTKGEVKVLDSGNDEDCLIKAKWE